ncbi:hypothetical protein [Moorena sp. SIO2C4]|nr:hypothetical protein [Moorena sp. SIO2C4]
MVVKVTRGRGFGEMGRWGDGEMGRWGVDVGWAVVDTDQIS